MPESAAPYLASYAYTAAEQDRRLELLSRFTPGQVSEALQDALFYTGDEAADMRGGIIVDPRGEDEDEGSRRVRVAMLKVGRKRGKWPWLDWMLKWGYPPGWVAGKSMCLFSGDLGR
jgi:hypothetical protein